jgi:hypothetical protein
MKKRFTFCRSYIKNLPTLLNNYGINVIIGKREQDLTCEEEVVAIADIDSHIYDQSPMKRV